MKILFNNARENENDQTVFFTLTDDEGNCYKWHGDIPKDAKDQQAYLEAHIDQMYCGILRKMYRDAPNTLPNLEDWQEWIDGGCKLEVQVGVDDKGEPVIEEKVVGSSKFKDTW